MSTLALIVMLYLVTGAMCAGAGLILLRNHVCQDDDIALTAPQWQRAWFLAGITVVAWPAALILSIAMRNPDAAAWIINFIDGNSNE